MDSDPDLALAIKRSLDDQKSGRANDLGQRKESAAKKKSKVIDLTESDEDDELPNPFAKFNAPSRVKDEDVDELLDEKKPSMEDQLAEIRAMHKRKADAQARENGKKRQDPVAGPSGVKRAAPSPAKRTKDQSEDDDVMSDVKPEGGPAVLPTRIAMKYEKGALRISKTPGRHSHKNAVGWCDIFVRSAITSTFCNFFFVAQDEFYRYLPLGRKEPRHVQVIIGRDIGYDPERAAACTAAEVEDKPALKKADHFAVARELAKIYKKAYGLNYQAVYPFCNGAVHSKVAVLVYLDMDGNKFLRVLITSCNAMKIDFEGGSNHHFIQDFPALKPDQRHLATEFETLLLSHLIALGAPLPFIEKLRSTYDFTKAVGLLIPSQPGSYHGPSFGTHGLGRLAELSRQILKDATKQEKSKKRLEVCTASIGSIKELWLRQVWHLIVGKSVKSIPTEDSDDALPAITIVYPTQASADLCTQEARDAASNMGSHAKYQSRPMSIKGLFHDYMDKIPGLLTHQKQLLLLAPSSQVPHFITIGSTNFSEAALGAIDFKMKSSTDARLTIKNYELSILFRGEDVPALLADGGAWDSIVTYRRPVIKYTMAGPHTDKPFSSGAWGH